MVATKVRLSGWSGWLVERVFASPSAQSAARAASTVAATWFSAGMEVGAVPTAAPFMSRLEKPAVGAAVDEASERMDMVSIFFSLSL